MDDDELNRRIIDLARLTYTAVKDPAAADGSALDRSMRALAGDLGNDLTKALGMALGLFGHFAASVEQRFPSVDVPAYLRHVGGHAEPDGESG
ncbi:hypothetical protein GCM10009839_55050 [Catenulispora yoronensis]|uniref:Uncharacterized protein n=1 Tax=Catenulispora yoronensis TaxID=450799 RepID=A0ABN2UWA5_9ACTN